MRSIRGRERAHLSRRSVLFLGIGGIVGPAVVRPGRLLAEPLPGPTVAPPPVRFDVFALGSAIGRHQVDFRPANGGFIADSDIDIDAKVLGVRLFSYTQKTSETWANGRLQAFTSTGVDDGKSFSASGRATGGAFVIEGSKGKITAPADVMLATYWSSLMLSRPQLINPKRGNLKEQTVKPAGQTTVRAGDGERTATRYDITGVLDGALFYDQEDHWVGAAFDRKGATVEYRLAA
ncbi:MAG: DUF6134 family protein [Rhodospirillales bacterium]